MKSGLGRPREFSWPGASMFIFKPEILGLGNKYYTIEKELAAITETTLLCRRGEYHIDNRPSFSVMVSELREQKSNIFEVGDCHSALQQSRKIASER